MQSEMCRIVTVIDGIKNVVYRATLHDDFLIRGIIAKVKQLNFKAEEKPDFEPHRRLATTTLRGSVTVQTPRLLITSFCTDRPFGFTFPLIALHFYLYHLTNVAALAPPSLSFYCLYFLGPAPAVTSIYGTVSTVYRRYRVCPNICPHPSIAHMPYEPITVLTLFTQCTETHLKRKTHTRTHKMHVTTFNALQKL